MDTKLYNDGPHLPAGTLMLALPEVDLRKLPNMTKSFKAIVSHKM